jgi:DNA-binding NarL/FixJ family response regulator
MSAPILTTTVDAAPPSGRALDDPIQLLIADDDPLTRELLAQALTDEGFLVLALVSDGTAACKQARQVRPEVVVMDMRMPDIGGVQAAQMIKAERPRTQILILSAHSEQFAALGPEISGVATLIGKNASLEEIVDAIRNASAVYRDLET